METGASDPPRAFPLFRPPGCPRPECRNLPPNPKDLFFRCRYVTDSYPGGVPLFDCLRCGRSFSLRRFSVEFYLHRQDQTDPIITQLVSSCSLRQAERAKKAMCRSSIERRLERFGKHAHRLLRRAVRERLKLDGEVQLDEAETFERDRRMGPVTAGTLVARESRYVVATAVGSMRPRIRPGHPRWRPKLEKELLPRVNQSNRVVSRCLSAVVRAAKGKVTLVTDQKPSYGMLLRRLDPDGRIHHRTHSSRLPRRTWNPLFPVNHLFAMTRDGISRLRRRTWCVSKKRRRLWMHLGLYYAWKNFVRTRFNEDEKTAAQYAKVTERQWEPVDLVRWRLDLGKVSLSPWVREPAGAAAA